MTALLEDGCWEALGWGEVEEALGRGVTETVTDTVKELEVEGTLARDVVDPVREPEVVVEEEACRLVETLASGWKFPKSPVNLMPSQHPFLLAGLPASALQQKLCVNDPFTTGQGKMLLKVSTATYRRQLSVQVIVDMSRQDCLADLRVMLVPF